MSPLKVLAKKQIKIESRMMNCDVIVWLLQGAKEKVLTETALDLRLGSTSETVKDLRWGPHHDSMLELMLGSMY